MFRVQLRINLASAMTYRANFLVEGIFSIAYSGLTLLPLFVVYGGGASFNGWDLSSALVVMAYFSALQALLGGVVAPSMRDLVERIRTGSFDYVLLKPIDAQAVVSASRCRPWSIVDLLTPIAMIVYAFVHRGSPPSPGALALGIALFMTGALAMYSLWVACAALAFWVGRLDNLLFLLGAIFDLAKWPVAVFPGVWRIIFTFVIPVAVMTTFPAMALLGSARPHQVVGAALGSAALCVTSRLIWRAALRGYTSASS
jgi:viologen exporter family transport system permease protein